MKTRQIRIPENLKIVLNEQTNNQGLIVQFHTSLWAIFKKHPERPEEYGFQIMNPETGETSEGTWGLSESQCTKVINKVIKKPGFGFGKTDLDLQKYIKKIIKKIKKV